MKLHRKPVIQSDTLDVLINYLAIPLIVDETSVDD